MIPDNLPPQPAALGTDDMVLRDYFAAAAIYGAAGQMTMPDPLPEDKIAAWAYQLADAMIRQRAA